MSLNNLLEKCKQISFYTPKDIEKYAKEKNIKSIGMVPMFYPAELVHAADMLPVGMWGSYDVQIDLSKQYFPAFCPSFVMAIMELGLNGSYDFLSAVIIPGMSDTLNSLGQNWKSGVSQVPFISIVYPQNRAIQCGIEYLNDELNNVKEKLEKISGVKISEEKLEKSLDLFNEHRKAMREFSRLPALHPNSINNESRAFVYKSAQYITKEDHLQIVNEINSLLKEMPEEKYSGHKIITTGILLDDPNLLKALDDNNLRIAGDYVVMESIQYNTDVPKDGSSQIENISLQWKNIEGFSGAYDPKMLRGSLIAKLAKERGADAAIFALTKFSDFEEYDMPICMSEIRKGGIQAFTFEIDQQDKGSEQVKTRIQTFADIL